VVGRAIDDMWRAVDRMVDRLALRFNRELIVFWHMQIVLAVDQAVDWATYLTTPGWFQVSVFDEDFVSELISSNWLSPLAIYRGSLHPK